MFKVVVLLSCAVIVQGFLFPGSGGGGGCGCAAPPPCPAPVAPVCPAPVAPVCPPPPSCGGGSYAAPAYGGPSGGFGGHSGGGFFPQQAPILQGATGPQGYVKAPQQSLPSLSLPIQQPQQQFIPQQQGPIGQAGPQGYAQGPQQQQFQQQQGPAPQQQFQQQQQQGPAPQQFEQQGPAPQQSQQPAPIQPVAEQAGFEQQQGPAPQQQQQSYQAESEPQSPSPYGGQEQQQTQQQQPQQVAPASEDSAYEDVGSNPGVGDIKEPYPEVNRGYNNNKKKAHAAPTATADPKCNSELMRRIIHENIHEKTSIAKRQIQRKGAAEIGGKIDVICSSGVFSYIVNTELYCETEKNGITCLMFRQAS